MSRKLITLAGALVAVLSLTLASADVEARQCRSHNRNQCCRQSSNCGYQQATNNCGSGCQQTARYAPTTTACCTPQSSFGSVTPVSGTMQPSYDTPTSAADSTPPTPIVTPTAPAPGA